MTEQDGWLPQPGINPDPSVSHPLEPQQVPYDQPFGVGQPPPTFYSRRRSPEQFLPLTASSTDPTSSYSAHLPRNGTDLSAVEGLALTWQKAREHLLEWLGFTVVLGLLSFGVAMLFLGFFVEESSPLITQGTESGGAWLSAQVLSEVWGLLCGAMAMQAALEMMRGRQVSFLGFFRIVNPLTILILALGFGAVSGGIMHFLFGGEYLVLLVNFFAFLAMAAAIEEKDGPLAALGRGLAFFNTAPTPMFKMLVATVIGVTILSFIPVLGGIVGTAAFALMIAYIFRSMQGYHVR